MVSSPMSEARDPLIDEGLIVPWFIGDGQPRPRRHPLVYRGQVVIAGGRVGAREAALFKLFELLPKFIQREMERTRCLERRHIARLDFEPDGGGSTHHRLPSDGQIEVVGND